MIRKIKLAMKCIKDNGFFYTIALIYQKARVWLKWKIFIENYYQQLEERVKRYKGNNPNVWRKTMIALIWWNIKCLFKLTLDGKIATLIRGKRYVSREASLPDPTSRQILLDKNKLNIAFYVRGGVGDCLIQANYIYKFRQKYSDEIIHIDIFAEDHRIGGVRTVFAGEHQSLYNCIYPFGNGLSFLNDYDVAIEILRYPEIKKKNLSKISNFLPELLEYIFLCERFRAEYPRFFSHQPLTDGQGVALCLLKGQKRIHQTDIYGFLEVSEQYEFPIRILENEVEYLSSLGLLNHRFIVLHRGCDSNYVKDSVKLWPITYYNILIRLLKAKYPDIVLLQIGVSHERCPSMNGVDINLVGKTTFEQVKVLLKHATLHIDGEGGLVHMRHAIGGGKSIVSFGPTSAEFYGYSENENISGSGCSVWCEWATRNWQEKCLRGAPTGMQHCMASIIPEMVMERIEQVLSKG